MGAAAPPCGGVDRWGGRAEVAEAPGGCSPCRGAAPGRRVQPPGCYPPPVWGGAAALAGRCSPQQGCWPRQGLHPWRGEGAAAPTTGRSPLKPMRGCSPAESLHLLSEGQWSIRSTPGGSSVRSGGLGCRSGGTADWDPRARRPTRSLTFSMAMRSDTSYITAMLREWAGRTKSIEAGARGI